MHSLKNELIWFSALLIVFVSFIVIVGRPQSSELVIAVAAFSFTWSIGSYFIKRIDVGLRDPESIKKELKWYVSIMIIFLSILVIVGSPGYSDLLIATAAFTFIWILRSYLVKKFALRES